MNIALDMMGGDFAPGAAADGISLFAKQNQASAFQLLLLGRKAEIEQALQDANLMAEPWIKIIDCQEVIDYHEHPVKALKSKPDSSIAQGFKMLATGQCDALISAGNTGAMLVGSMFSLKPCVGVLRPTIATIIPRENNKTGLLLDVGINTDCKPEYLNQFAAMGATYAKEMLSIEMPRTALLNIGEEEGKGNLLCQAAYPLLKENPFIHFIGNIEGRDLLEDKADVVVCDGFTGNVLLKLLESIHPVTKRQGISHPYLDRFHFEQYGGTPVLGVEKPVIIGHGISGAEAFANMIAVASKMISTDFIAKLTSALVQ